MATVIERVDKGMALLDEVLPDWRDRVPVDLHLTLDMSHPSSCILGHVYKDEAQAKADKTGHYVSGFGFGMVALGLSKGPEATWGYNSAADDYAAAEYGFDCDPDHETMDSAEEYALLNEAWLRRAGF